MERTSSFQSNFEKMDDSFPPRLTGGELLKKEIILENNGILSNPRTFTLLRTGTTHVIVVT